MMDHDFVDQHFQPFKVDDNRWRFEPEHWRNDAPLHRYFLTFLVPERRFILTRQRVEKPVTVDDEEQLAVFRSFLSAEAIADCMRRAIGSPPPEDDGIPF